MSTSDKTPSTPPPNAADDEYEEEEYYIVASLPPGALAEARSKAQCAERNDTYGQPCPHYALVDIDTDSPFLELEGSIYRGTKDELLGSTMVFETVVDESVDSKLLGVTSQMIKFQPNNYGLVNIFKKNLKLLSISTKWRRLALPYAYQTAFITYEDEADDSLSSNLDLIQAANCVELVRNLHISMYYSSSPADGLLQVVGELSKLYGSQVQSLSMLLTHKGLNPAIQAAEDEQYRQAAGDIAALFPQITKLKFDGSFATDATKKISSYIASQYAEQLESLESEYPISGCTFSAIKYFSVNAFGDDYFEIPQMPAGQLEYLELFNLPLDCSWDSFARTGDVVFSNLTKLFISYTSIPDETQQYVLGDYRLVCPKLDTFSINGVRTRHSVLNQIVFPKEMNKLYINCHGDMFQSLKDSRLPKTKLLFLSTSLENDANPRTASYMNQLVSNAAGTEQVHLWINRSTCSVSAGDITCSAITRLRIEVPIDMEIFLSLISTLPNLERIDVGCLNVDSRQYVDLSTAGEQPLAPFNAKLKWLAANFDWSVELSPSSIDALVYVLLKLPMLEEAMIGQCEPGLHDKLKLFAELYPHLNDINFH
ncbi:hypothetical protein EV183_004476 [Coemansia sp. RSA 2336]|nr:hypothetical protein EV183_004476 [Coemansia sp. RSA 2336]